jgi:transposase-like protein
VPWKDRKAVARDLKTVYGAATIKEAEHALDKFSDTWDAKYPAISPSWRSDWERLTVFFDYSPEIRKAIYTTNAIESLNYSLRKILKNRGAFPNDDAIFKILYLAISRVAKKWTMPIRNWKAALNQFVILFGDRVPV